MNLKQKKRLVGVIGLFLLIGIAIALILYALKQNINLFVTPTDLSQQVIRPEQILRVGGYVKKNSVHYDKSGEHVTFIITDHANDVTVNYHGLLPSLFREEQGIVVTGQLTSPKLFIADQVLAKHDEKYMPWPLSKELTNTENKNAT
jgi:cytochrome c-type biogenesis protein CcmE